MIDEPNTRNRTGGETLLDHYWHANSKSESMRYFTHGRNKHSYKSWLEWAIQIVASFKNDPETHLQIINEFNMKFMIRNQTKNTVWYALSLNTKCYECEYYIAVCKHLLAVWMLVDGESQYLKMLLSSQKQMFYYDANDDFEEETSNFVQSVPSTNMWSPPPNNPFGIFFNSKCLKFRWYALLIWLFNAFVFYKNTLCSSTHFSIAFKKIKNNCQLRIKTRILFQHLSK